MILIDSKAHDLIEQYQSARAEEGAAITALHSYMQLPNQDQSAVRELMQSMEKSHNKAMDIWDQLKPFRLN